MSMIEVNLNELVRVKLTEEGVKQYKRSFLKYGIEPSELTVNESGYCRFQLWELMNIFGEKMFLGSETMFERNNIIVEVSAS